MRVIFMGSPEFALPSLHVLAQDFDLVGVITQPDRPAGRGRRLTSSPVKLAALDLGISPLQPRRLSDPEVLIYLKQLDPHLIIVTAFGQILPSSILDLPPFGCINVHASLLPRWRGAAPVQAAILHGDHETGVTIMKMDPGLDTGPIISQKPVPILPQETGGDLSMRLASLGAKLLQETLTPYCNGKLHTIPQDDSLATSAPLLRKSDGILDWRKPSTSLHLQVRAYEPWPRSFFQWQNQRIAVRKARSQLDLIVNVGEVVRFADHPAVGTPLGALVLEIVHPPGRKPIPGNAFLNSAPSFLGSVLELPS
jgi:methionyl-tRNA formyltransferase